MIVVSVSAHQQISIWASADETSAAVVLGSMLNSRYNPKTGAYFIPIHEFNAMHEKLQRAGVQLGPLSPEVLHAVGNYGKQVLIGDQIKIGALNHEIELYLSHGLLKSKLWPDQVSDVRFCLRNPKVGVFNEMGTGKTLEALATFAMLKLAGLARYALVVCPNNVKQTWIQQISRHTKFSAVELGNGSAKQLSMIKKHSKNRPDIFITHYDAVRNQKVSSAIAALPFDMVICDEAHAFKNMTAQRSKAIAAMLNSIRSSLSLVEVEVETEDGAIVKTVLREGVQPGQEVEFW